MSFKFAQALAFGRDHGWKPATREEVLLRLLRKRAAAHRAGLAEQEATLRGQILWALPMRSGEEIVQDN